MHWKDLLEPEETVGRWWHRWAVRTATYTHHVDAEIRLDELEGALGVFHRAIGGAPGLSLTAVGQRRSGHRLTLRQKLGYDAETVPVAQCDGDTLLLPVALAVFETREDNRRAYYWLTAQLVRSVSPESAADPLRSDLFRLRAIDQAVQATQRVLPGLAEGYRALAATVLDARRARPGLPAAERRVEAVVCGLLGDDAGEPWLERVRDHRDDLADVHAPRGYRPFLPVPIWGERVPRGSLGPVRNGEASDEARPGSAFDAGRTRRHAEYRALDQAERDDPLLWGMVHGLMTWGEMVNVNRDVEDEDPEQARRAAEDLDHLTLTDHLKRAATRLKMELDLVPRTDGTDALAGPLTYPEWDYSAGRYRPRHVRVYTGLARDDRVLWSPDAETRRRIRQVRRRFGSIRPQRSLLRAQPDGDELDTDALVASRCNRRASGELDHRVYQQHLPALRDLSVAVLVDVSLSTESWVEERQVLEVEKAALTVLLHALESAGDEHGVFAFTSRRRHRVHVDVIKGFSERAGEQVHRRIAALGPGYYTRMGAAIRHVGEALARRPHRHRLLLVLTDGKPNDNDHYEGRYAVEDTRRAVREARATGNRVFGITIDGQAQGYFPYLFGRGGYAIVERISRLPMALPSIYRQLMR